MYDTERLIKNINATMTMSDMPLTEESKALIRKCHNGSISFDKALKDTIKKYTHK